MPLKRLTRPARKSPLPGKNRITGRPGFAGTCQTMTFSPSAVVRTCSSACGKPAASGEVRAMGGIGNSIDRCMTNSAMRPQKYTTETTISSHFSAVIIYLPTSHPLDDVLGHLLGVAEQHHGVVSVE